MFNLTNDPGRDLYVKILQYGDSHPEGFTLKGLKENLNLGEREFELIRWEAGREFIFRKVGITKEENSSVALYMLSFEDRFKLLEYIELQEARRSSRIATRIAIFAIVISIFVALWQILFPTKVILIEDRTKQKVEELIEK